MQKEILQINTDIAAMGAKRIRVEGFLRELDKLEGPLTSFDPLVWQATIHHMKVFPDCTVSFVFRDGSEVTRKI